MYLIKLKIFKNKLVKLINKNKIFLIIKRKKIKFMINYKLYQLYNNI